jgi:hypothetical protein
MAAIENTGTVIVQDQVLESVPSPFARISWGAIIAGLILVCGIHLLLNLLGLGIGLSTIRPSAGDNPSAEMLGAGALMWWVVVTWVALLLGGYVASRLAGSFRTQDGMLHGIIVWSLALVLSALAVGSVIGTGGILLGNIAGSLAGQHPQTGGAGDAGIAPAAASVMEAPSSRGLASTQGADYRAIMAETNALLRPADPARLSDDQAREEIQAGLAAIAGGQGVDHDRLAAVISAKTGISQTEAASRLTALESRMQQARAEAQEKATQLAHQATIVGRRIALGGFFVILFGAIAGAVGGWIGTVHGVAYRERHMTAVVGARPLG